MLHSNWEALIYSVLSLPRKIDPEPEAGGVKAVAICDDCRPSVYARPYEDWRKESRGKLKLRGERQLKTSSAHF